MNVHKKLYWANSFFTAADRSFNSQCAKILRDAGYEVFLPQETSTNAETTPSSQEIFREDTVAILNSDLIVACLDQETIDSGVACEIGIAYSRGIPIAGIYTDIRQYRTGPGRMYKNLYVMGAIERLGNIASSIDELVNLIRYTFERTESPGRDNTNNSTTPEYDTFIDELESWYNPPWDMKIIVERWIKTSPGAHLVDIGCGSGRLAKAIRALNINVSYHGWDPAHAVIAEAKRQELANNFYFTNNFLEIEKFADSRPFDIAALGFVLHDHDNREDIIDRCSRLVKRNGNIIIIDLMTGDLPRLTSLLQRYLATPIACPDHRINPAWIREMCLSLELQLVDCRLDILNIQFPSQDAINRYLRFFNIDRGMDLPLCIGRDMAEARREQITAAVSSIEPPFQDIRIFFSCLLEKS